MALGAPAAAVRRLVVGESGWTVAAGLAVGLAAAALVGTLVRGQLFGVEPYDPVSLSAASVLLAALALGAAYLPARRASRIDPLVALRHE
jgi:ABC-type antimicrobial peptide transport system permease subunit